MPYYVYIIQSEKGGTYYVGSTQDLNSRLDRHNQGRSKYTKASTAPT
ncbi:MAG: GIY-YIG nuclease family protein [Candidatus Desulfacyla sp.]